MNGFHHFAFHIIGILFSQVQLKLGYGMFHVKKKIIMKLKKNKQKSIFIKKMKMLNQLMNNFFVLMFL